MTKTQPDNLHFFASSAFTWATTSPTRSLHQLVKLMDKEKMGYNLWLIPHPHDTPYEIEFYQPKIDGAQWVGYMEPTTRKGKK